MKISERYLLDINCLKTFPNIQQYITNIHLLDIGCLEAITITNCPLSIIFMFLWVMIQFCIFFGCSRYCLIDISIVISGRDNPILYSFIRSVIFCRSCSLYQQLWYIFQSLYYTKYSHTGLFFTICNYRSNSLSISYIFSIIYCSVDIGPE